MALCPVNRDAHHGGERPPVFLFQSRLPRTMVRRHILDKRVAVEKVM